MFHRLPAWVLTKNGKRWVVFRQTEVITEMLSGVVQCRYIHADIKCFGQNCILCEKQLPLIPGEAVNIYWTRELEKTLESNTGSKNG